MKQIIPFTKDITFKTKIGELTSISLDNDLILKGEDLISGNFYIKGTYKMLRTSELEEPYSYKIPCEIAISDDYDTYDATIDIDDFNYEIINEEILRVKIAVEIDNLEQKEIIIPEEELVLERKEEEKITLISNEKENIEEYKDKERCIEPEDIDDSINFKNIKLENKEEEKIDPITLISQNKEEIANTEETYLTYSVYIVREEDTIESILDKYQITKYELEEYNDMMSITSGTKLIIPSFSND